MIWDISTGACIHTLTGYTCAYSLDGSQLVSDSTGEKTVRIWNIINKKRDTYLKNTLSWQQVLLLLRIINHHSNPIDFARDAQVHDCYTSLPKDVKQLVKPLLSQDVQSALDENIVHRDKRIRKE